MMTKHWEKADFNLLLHSMSNEERKKRHDIRYACFRMQTNTMGGSKPEKKHQTLAKKIEKLKGFEGWDNFAVTWDVSMVTPIVLVKRKWSVLEEWNQTLKRVTMQLPGVKIGDESNI